MKKRPQEILDDDMPPASLSVGPLGVLSSVLIALMSSAILYNLIWRQHATPTGLKAEERSYVEIIAGDGKTGSLEPAARVSVKKNSERTPLNMAVQEELVRLGLFEGPVDGILGDKTRTAVTAYQRKHSLPLTGKADRKLLDHMRFTSELLSASRYTTAISKIAPDDKVASVQKGLAALGYRPGAFDGVLGDATREAIRQFERDRNWPVTGEPSDLLIAELSDIGAFAGAP